ncbi:MAG: hypothetical protein E7172_01565 [Firmicutes bacterium]|nr:hypothetical protein [Bacillota bacterium]
MKIPLRYQISEYDCGRVTWENALSYLLNREEIPAIVLKKIGEYTLDCQDKNGNIGQGGTSRKSSKKLTKWMKMNFNKINVIRLVKKDITFKVLKNCLNNDGVVIARCWQKNEHYVLITRFKKDQFYIFDPYLLPKNFYKNDKCIKIIHNKNKSYNRIVKQERLFSSTKYDFSLGNVYFRECILIYKK